ncbi:hypothetical protein [uncultured Methanoregula sp.]|uniref:hypothetical protein n=1 Tax=uncultured Methanoregula sp. TaxID=1005933 RepID=UPI002AAC019D|nr:hypothetical protein [uncultured Methanoregula sp.]
MTSRRGTLVEDGARELLQVSGYAVRIVPPGYPRGYPPVHLIATRPSGETRFIRVRKISRRPSTAESIPIDFPLDLARLREYLSGHSGVTGLRCELWLYSLTYGFRCFEILPESIREIREPSTDEPGVAGTRGAA